MQIRRHNFSPKLKTKPGRINAKSVKNYMRGTPAADSGIFLFLPGVQEANFHNRRDVAEILCGLQEEILSALFEELWV